MNKFLVKLLNVIIIIIIAPVLIVGFIPFAIFRGFTDEFTMDEYFNIWGSFLNMLAYPVTKYEERKEHYEELKRKIKYYREECGRLNNIIDELEKEKREEEKSSVTDFERGSWLLIQSRIIQKLEDVPTVEMIKVANFSKQKMIELEKDCGGQYLQEVKNFIKTFME